MPSTCERIYRNGPQHLRRSRPASARAARRGVANLEIVAAASSGQPQFKFWSPSGCQELPFEPSAVPLGTCQQVFQRPPVNQLLAETEHSCRVASSRLRQALIGVGRVRPAAIQFQKAIDVDKDSACNAAGKTPCELACARQQGKAHTLPRGLDFFDCSDEHASNVRCNSEAFAEEMLSEEFDSFKESYKRWMEHNANANRWIYETIPRHGKVNKHWHEKTLREWEESKQVREVLRKYGRKKGHASFQAYVNAKYKNDSYDCVNLLPLRAGSVATVESASESTASDHEVTDGFKEIFHRKMQKQGSMLGNFLSIYKKSRNTTFETPSESSESELDELPMPESPTWKSRPVGERRPSTRVRRASLDSGDFVLRKVCEASTRKMIVRQKTYKDVEEDILMRAYSDGC